jgi:hypothetical protein
MPFSRFFCACPAKQGGDNCALNITFFGCILSLSTGLGMTYCSF